MKTTQEIIKVMQAYDRGEQIEFKSILTGWECIHKPIWDWSRFDYRVKPKTKYVSVETADEFLAELRKHGIFFINVESKIYSLQNIFADHKFFDDRTPYGK